MTEKGETMVSLNDLDITNLKIMPSKFDDSPTRALCTAVFNDALVVSGIRIKEGKKGIYVSFPMMSRHGNPKPRPVVYPANPVARKEISNRILATYVINHCVDDYQA